MRNTKLETQQEQELAAKTGEIMIGNDLRVTRLGFGAMRITGDGIWGEPADRAGAVKVLQRAVELGINLIDTADSYGPNVSEEIIAEALHPYPPNLVIATKGGFQRPGPNRWVESGTPEHLRSACEGSLRRLRLDRIDLYQLHRIDPKVPAEDQLGTLKDLQAEGKIRHIGLSEVSVRQIEHAQTIVPIVSVQNRYSFSSGGAMESLAIPGRSCLAACPVSGHSADPRNF
ncbi:MAG: aldo/keto reductase [Thermoguttaceae bacterium]